jgi:hypothetical protein
MDFIISGYNLVHVGMIKGSFYSSLIQPEEFMNFRKVNTP